MPLPIPAQQEVSQKGFYAPVPKELGLPSLEGGNIRQLEQEKGVQNGGGQKTKKGKTCENRTKEGPRTGVRTSGKTNSTPGYASLHRAGPGGGEKNIKRGAKIELGASLLLVFWVDLPSPLEDVFSFAF